MMKNYRLNDRALAVVDELIESADLAKVSVSDVGGATVVDCGIRTTGSLAAGRALAKVCLADAAVVGLSLGRLADRPCSVVTVELDDPAVACLLSQYAGWKLAVGDYFAMASGPMRAMRGKEPVFERLAYREWSEVAVGVLESAKLPTEPVIEEICRELNTEPEDLTLLVAPTASLAGGLQVVARSVETCMHKLFELGYDVRKARSAVGTAFLPPVPKTDLQAIGRTNDSILYGAAVQLWVEGEDAALAELGPRLPAAASPDYGVPFAEVFQRYKGDFYAIDPLLFSPALVAFNNLSTGTAVCFGGTDHDLLARSFFEAAK